MASAVDHLLCTACSAKYSDAAPLLLCPRCGGLLEVQYDYAALASSYRLDGALSRSDNIWRWRELLPVRDDLHIVTLGEGGTPLHDCPRLARLLGIHALLVKDEALNPTASFKDRTMSVAVSKAVELGIRRAITFSSGNAGGSLAAYAAKAGIDVLVLVDEATSPQKIAMVQAYGQRVVQLRCSGDYLWAKLEQQRSALGLYEFTSFINPYRHEGTKTYAYELCLQLDWSPPDAVVFPIGTGSGIYGAWKGFRELALLGLIGRVPRLIGVQAEASAPIVDAFLRNQHSASVAPGETRSSVAHAIAPSNPIGGSRGPLEAMRASGGRGVTVSDDEILQAQGLLGREGIFAEPAAAASLAAARKLAGQGEFDSQQIVACIMTASGLKQPDSVALHRGAPESMDLADLEQLLVGYQS